MYQSHISFLEGLSPSCSISNQSFGFGPPLYHGNSFLTRGRERVHFFMLRIEELGIPSGTTWSLAAHAWKYFVELNLPSLWSWWPLS